MTDQLECPVDLEPYRPATEVFEVTRDSIQRFAIATGIRSPIHLDITAAREAGHPDVVAPPYFFVSLGLAMGQMRPRAQLGEGGIPLDDPLADSKVVAGETRVEWFGSMFAGDVVEVVRTFVDVERKRGRSGPFEIYTFQRDYSRSGELLVRETYARIAR